MKCCSPVIVHWRFSRTYRLHLQVQSLIQPVRSRLEIALCCHLITCLASPLNLKMEAVRFSETSVYTGLHSITCQKTVLFKIVTIIVFRVWYCTRLHFSLKARSLYVIQLKKVVCGWKRRLCRKESSRQIQKVQASGFLLQGCTLT
jgi:hypothetical protein